MLIKTFRQSVNRRLKYKVIVPFMGLAAILLLLLTALTFYTVANRLEAQLERDLHKSATATGLELEYLEQDLLDRLNIVVNAPGDPSQGLMATDAAFAGQQHAEIQRILTAARDYYELPHLLALDSRGQVIVDVATDEVRRSQDSLHGSRDLASVSLVQAVLANQADALGDKYAGFLFVDSERAKPVFVMVAPVRWTPSATSTQQVVGAILVSISLDSLVRQRLPERNGFAVTAILDEHGRVLGSNAPGNNGDLAFDPRLMGGSSALVDQRSLGGQSYAILYSPLRVRHTLSPYFFAVAQSRDLLITTWADSRSLIVAIGMITLSAVLLVGTWITNRITQPLSHLAATALDVKQGHFERRSTIQQDDEVGTLSDVLNAMTDRLLDLYDASRHLGAQLSLAGVRQQALAAVERLLPLEDGWMFVLIDQQWVYSTASGTSTIELPMPHTTEERHPSLDELFPESNRPEARFITRPSLTLSLTSPHGTIGLLVLTPKEYPASLTPILEPLLAMGSIIGTALHNSILYRSVQQEAAKQRAIVQSIADGVLVLDATKRIVGTNQAASLLFGQPSQTLMQHTLDDLLLQPVPEQPGVFGASSAGPAVYQMGDHIVHMRQSPIHTDEGQLTGDVVVFHDVTNERAIDRAKTAFIATISHELRTPLTSIIGYTDILLRGITSPPTAEQEEFLRVIRTQTQTMNAVIQNMILVARIDAGAMQPDLKPYSVESVVHDGVAGQQSAIGAKGLELDIAVEPGLPPVLVDRDHMQTIFQQVLHNACRYTITGGIRVRAYRDEAYIRMDVSDTGPGIDPESLATLFTRFQRGGEQGGLATNERGAGLGLVIVRHLVELMGGDVVAQSRLGEGTTVSWRVPYAPA